MASEIHSAGLELILDMVYNLTVECSELGPVLSTRGIDNATYYRLMPDSERFCMNDSGTGNTLNLTSGDLLNQRGRRPASTVNFITAHDGCTLNDLVSHNKKHIEAIGDGNRDGNDNNIS